MQAFQFHRSLYSLSFDFHINSLRFAFVMLRPFSVTKEVERS